MGKSYIIEVKTKNNLRKTLGTLGTAAVLGTGLGGIAISAAKMAGVGRFAPTTTSPETSRFTPIQNLPTTPVQNPEIPAQRQVEKKQQTQRVDLHNDTIDFLKSQEDFKPKAYWDKKQFSVGYGSGMFSDGKKVQQGTTVTPEQAHEMLVGHINQRIIPKVKDLPIWQNMNDRQRGGFISFLYNVGEHVIGSKNHPSINAAIHSGDVNRLYDAMGMYIHATEKDKKTGKMVKKKLPGLVNRRAAEKSYAFGESK